MCGIIFRKERNLSKGAHMTEEMIKAIQDAETKALEIKQDAIAKAEALLSDAQEQANRLKASSEEVLKAYKETQLKSAKDKAERLFEEEIALAKKSAQSYCAEVLQNAETSVTDIVGRVISGNR
jgi:vacuolar-type H+-ATPase subunit H